MPRTTIAAIQTVGGYPTAGVAAAATAADAVNFNQTLHTGQNFIIHARNTAATTRAITISSVADALQHRTLDISDTLTNAQSKIYGPFAIDGWKQTDGYLYFQAAHAEVVFTVIRF